MDFDDRPKRTKHTVRDLTIGIPFLSNIPSKVEITTQPVFEAKVNGSPVRACTARRSRSAGRARRPWTSTSRTSTCRTTSPMSRLDPVEADGRPAGREARARVPAAANGAPGPHPLGHGRAAQPRRGDRAAGRWSPGSGSRRRSTPSTCSAEGAGRQPEAVAPEVWMRRETNGEHNIATAFVAPGRRRRSFEWKAAKRVGRSRARPLVVEIAEMGIERGNDPLRGSRPPAPSCALHGRRRCRSRGFDARRKVRRLSKRPRRATPARRSATRARFRWSRRVRRRRDVLGRRLAAQALRALPTKSS